MIKLLTTGHCNWFKKNKKSKNKNNNNKKETRERDKGCVTSGALNTTIHTQIPFMVQSINVYIVLPLSGPWLHVEYSSES